MDELIESAEEEIKLCLSNEGGVIDYRIVNVDFGDSKELFI